MQRTATRSLDYFYLFQPLRDAVSVPVDGSEAFQVPGVGREFHDACKSLVAVGLGVSTEGDDGLAGEIVALGECVDDHRGSPPPYGATDEDGVV